MKFKIGKYQIELEVSYIESGFIAGCTLNYWAGFLEGNIDIFKHSISLCIYKAKEE